MSVAFVAFLLSQATSRVVALSGCELYKKHTELHSATLERHLDAFGNDKLDEIMADYSADAVIQVPDELGGTICGKDAISKFFSGFFTIKPAGSPINMIKKETVCAGASACASYIWYNMSSAQISFPQATDTFVYNAHGQIVSQTFAGVNEKSELTTMTASSTGNGCDLYKKDTGLYSATLERHLDAFGNDKLDAIMADYHEDAVLQVPDELGGTICGKNAINKFFSGFFAIKPAGSPINMFKKETVCSGGASACASYIWYNMSSAQISFPHATDTFVYNVHGQIVSQTFAGRNMHSTDVQIV